MKIYCMSDIHGCLAEFEEALFLVLEHLREEDTMLLLLGDYVHGGPDSRGVLKRIMDLQEKYGPGKVTALLGNHDMWLLDGSSTIDQMMGYLDDGAVEDDGDDDQYLQWLETLPRYFAEGNTIFVHAGIDETLGESWEWSDDTVFTDKYPAELGKIPGLEQKVVAGHVGTAEIAGAPWFHDIYFDGASHYYIDGTVLDSGTIPVLMVDTSLDRYYRVTERGNWPVTPYGED